MIIYDSDNVLSLDKIKMLEEISKTLINFDCTHIMIYFKDLVHSAVWSEDMHGQLAWFIED